MTSTYERGVVRLLGELGYASELCEHGVVPPGETDRLDIVAYTRTAPKDLRTSAIAVSLSSTSTLRALELARRIAAPVALVIDASMLAIFAVAASPSEDQVISYLDAATPSLNDAPEFLRLLDPESVHRAKVGARQLSLFPIDVRLLEHARSQSADAIQHRVEAAFEIAAKSAPKSPPARVARLVVSALAAVVVRDKYSEAAKSRAAVIASALQRHPAYFGDLAEWELRAPKTVGRVIDELSEAVDYSNIDARSVNTIYERLFMTPALRKDLGIFYTDLRLATRIVETIPFEEVAPDGRRVFDPACGSGNLLLAAQERLEAIAPGSWSPEQTHAWLKSHLRGSDVDPVAAELARLSLLISALPLGNKWQVDTDDFLKPDFTLDDQPTVIVTNPPWRTLKGQRKERATQFLSRAVDLLAEDGFLACILPVSWLSATQHEHSRRELRSKCDLFEVWRLPRDMFADARTGCAVVFAQKRKEQRRDLIAYRWVLASKDRRNSFLDEGRTSYKTVVHQGLGGADIALSPLDEVVNREPDRLVDHAKVISGLVQLSSPEIAFGHEKAIPMLLRNTTPSIYKVLSSDDVTYTASLSHVDAGRRAHDLSVAPKLLVQAHRFPDNPWRLRPIVDTLGVIPSEGWNAVVPGEPGALFALHALLASAAASCWVHSRASTKRIPVDVLEHLPMPRRWTEMRDDLAALGSAITEPGVDHAAFLELDRVVLAAYGAPARLRRRILEFFDSYKAPEGNIRYLLPEVEEAIDGQGFVRPGSVLGISGQRLRIWTVDGPDGGVLVDLPDNLSGWLCEPGATFEVAGDVVHGRYHFHRSAFRSDEELFGSAGEA